VLRCFYGSALKSGEDLKIELQRLLAGGKKMVLGLAIVVLCATPFTGLAGQASVISSREMDRSIEETLERREFAWRMPRETGPAGEPEAKGPLAAAIKWLLDVLAKGTRALEKLITLLIDWLQNQMTEEHKTSVSSNKNWVTSVRVVLILLLLLFSAVLTFVFFRIRRRRRTGRIETTVVDVAPLPDLNDESTSADELPADRWLVLAEEFTTRGELRLAMRALYLATLACLAEKELITIEAYKSNREYERELKRRAHEREEMLVIFSKSLNFFERVWYGMHRIPPADFDDFSMNLKRILAFASDATVNGFRGSEVQGSHLM
jgi:hypothetical protein